MNKQIAALLLVLVGEAFSNDSVHYSLKQPGPPPTLDIQNKNISLSFRQNILNETNNDDIYKTSQITTVDDESRMPYIDDTTDDINGVPSLVNATSATNSTIGSDNDSTETLAPTIVTTPMAPAATNNAVRALPLFQCTSFLFVMSNAIVSVSPAPALTKILGAERATSTLSLMSATTATAQIALNPVIGSVLDSVGRKPAFVVSTLCICTSYCITALHPTLWTICISKVVNALAVGIFLVTSQALLGDITASSANKVGAVLGRQYALISSGFLLGAIAAGRIADFGLRASYGTSALTSSLALVLAIFGIPETLPQSQRLPYDSKSVRRQILESPLSSTRLLAKHGSKMRNLAILLLLQSIPAHSGDFAQLFATKYWNLGPKGFSNIIALVGLSGVVANMAASVLLPRLGPKRFTTISTLSSMFFPIGACFSYKSAMIGGCIGFMGASQMLATTAAMTSHAAKSGHPQGELAGERASLIGLLKIVGPVFYSILYLQGQRLGIPQLPFLFNVFTASMALVVGLQCLTS